MAGARGGGAAADDAGPGSAPDGSDRTPTVDEALREAEAARRRLAYVAEASLRLASSLDVDLVVSELGALVVPEIADWCTIDLVDDRSGEVRRASVVHRDPALHPAAEALARIDPVAGEGDPVGRAMATGQPVLDPSVREDVLFGIARHAEHLAVVRALGFHSWLTVPLVAGGRAFGAVTLVTTDASARRLQEGDVALAVDLARRAAVALEQARLHREVAIAARRREESLALVDALLAGAPVGLSFVGRDLRYVRVNEAMAAIHRRPVEDHIGRSIDEVLAPLPSAIATIRRTLELGEAVRDREITTDAFEPGGEPRHYLASHVPVRGPDGEIMGVGSAVIDLTERHRAEAEREILLERERAARAAAEAAQSRLAFLAEASRHLATSLEPDEVSRGLARLAAGHLADWVLVDIVTNEGLVERAVTEHRDPAKAGLVAKMAEGPRDVDGHHPLAHVLKTGEPIFVPSVSDDDLGTWARDEAQLAVLRELGVHSLIVVPLMARGRTLGILVLVTAGAERELHEADLTIAADLARRAGVAVDNARLHAEQARIARVLQESLLPPALPEVPGLDVATAYLPAGEGVEVGGDFFDVFQTGDEDWVALIGDVCGTGAEAAAVTSLARHTVRAGAMSARRPSQVLGLLNDVLTRREGEGRFLTVGYVRLHPQAGRSRFTVSCAGHPPPLLVRADGEVVDAGRPGTVLGVVPDPDLHEVDGELRPGDALVLFTDGVIEAKGAAGGRYGESRLRAVLAEVAGASAGSIVDRVVDDVRSYEGGAPHDDVAVVVLTVPGAG